MSAVKELIEKSKVLTMENRVSIAKDITSKLIADLKAMDIKTENVTNLLINIFKLFVSADRKARRDEYDLFTKLFDLDIDTDTFFNLTNYGSDKDFIAKMDELVDAAPVDVAVNIVTLGILIITADGEATAEEIALLEKIYNR